MCTHLRSLMRWCRTNQLEIVWNCFQRNMNEKQKTEFDRLIWLEIFIVLYYSVYIHRYNNTHIGHWDMVKLNYKFNSENCEIHIRKTICWLIFFTFAWMSRMNDGCRSIVRNLGLPFHSNVSTFHHPPVGYSWSAAALFHCHHIPTSQLPLSQT